MLIKTQEIKLIKYHNFFWELFHFVSFLMIPWYTFNSIVKYKVTSIE